MCRLFGPDPDGCPGPRPEAGFLASALAATMRDPKVKAPRQTNWRARVPRTTGVGGPPAADFHAREASPGLPGLIAFWGAAGVRG
jgi:hypothetical protein